MLLEGLRTIAGEMQCIALIIVYGSLVLIGLEDWKRIRPTIEAIGEARASQFFRDMDGKKIDPHAFTWRRMGGSTWPEQAAQRRYFQSLLGEDYRFNTDKYSYIATYGYTLKKIRYHYRGACNSQREHVPVVHLGTDCGRDSIGLYRISHSSIGPVSRRKLLMRWYERIDL